MRGTKAIRAIAPVLLIVGLIGSPPPAHARQNESANGPLPAAEALSFAEREAAAEARILKGSSPKDVLAWTEFEAIARDPLEAARTAAEQGDFRLIRVDRGGFPQPYEPLFEGVDCSLVWATILTRAEWRMPFSDVLPLDPVSEAIPRFDPAVARAYNLALLQHTSFPYPDLCVPGGSPEGEAMFLRGTQAAKEMRMDPQMRNLRIVPTRWWQRWSSRRIPEKAAANPLILAIRNEDPLPRIERFEVDQVDEFGLTALGWAAARASPEVIRELLSLGADPWFGEMCSTRTRSPDRYGAWGGDVMITPLVIAMVNGHRGIAMEMIRKVPRKECAEGSSPLADLHRKRLVITMVGTYASAYGADDVHGIMISDFLDQVSAQETTATQRSYNDMVKYAWVQGLDDVLLDRPSRELVKARDFNEHMARFSSLDELSYWIERLDLHQPDKIAEMISAVRFNRFGTRGMREDFGRKFEILAAMGADLKPQEKQGIVKKIFSSAIFSNDDTEAKRTVISILMREGYDLSSASLVYPPQGPAQSRCSPLMVVLSYSFSECRPNDVDPEVAMALLDAGVDPNEGRTELGFSALDLAELRASSGPWPEAFAKVRDKLIAMGALPGRQVLQQSE